MVNVINRRFLSNFAKNSLNFVRCSHEINTTVEKTLTLNTLNPNLVSKKLLWFETKQIQETFKGMKKHIHRLDTEDAQALGQQPITFLRHVLILTTYPALLTDKNFPEDVKVRAKTILEKCPGGSIGSYSDACGIEIIRRQIAKYIENRDNIPSHWRNCIMGHGSEDMVKKFLGILCAEVNGLKPGVLNPVPENPLHSNLLAELGLKKIDYHLDEDNNWKINIDDLKRVVNEARKTCNPRAIIVTNPGNPTAHVLKRKAMETLIKFAYEEKLILVADEVYQDNIIQPNCKFISFKKVMSELGEPYGKMELVSLNSISKGYFAESGIKAGYAEVMNMDPEVVPMFVKSISAMLCPSVLAQIAIYAQMNPPTENEPSYELFQKEKSTILANMRGGASMLEECLDSLGGVSHSQIQGGIFSYPQLFLPRKIVEEAGKVGLSADEYYAMELLKRTGICVLPGTEFGQHSGRYHIRMTIMPKLEIFRELLERYKKFHDKFVSNSK